MSSTLRRVRRRPRRSAGSRVWPPRSAHLLESRGLAAAASRRGRCRRAARERSRACARSSRSGCGSRRSPRSSCGGLAKRSRGSSARSSCVRRSAAAQQSRQRDECARRRGWRDRGVPGGRPSSRRTSRRPGTTSARRSSCTAIRPARTTRSNAALAIEPFHVAARIVHGDNLKALGPHRRGRDRVSRSAARERVGRACVVGPREPEDDSIRTRQTPTRSRRSFARTARRTGPRSGSRSRGRSKIRIALPRR